MKRPSTQRHRSRGITLVIVLVFLLLITMFSISAIRASSTNLRLTQNMELRQEATAAAQAAIETVISSPAFHAASAPVPANVPVDVDGDAAVDYTVTVSPEATCSRIRTLLNADLPRAANTGLPAPQWIRCDSGGGGSGSGSLIEGGLPAVAPGQSFCVETRWNLQADVTDARTGTQVQVNQGVAVPYSVGESQERCARLL